jgi:hypothetical protein
MKTVIATLLTVVAMAAQPESGIRAVEERPAIHPEAALPPPMPPSPSVQTMR